MSYLKVKNPETVDVKTGYKGEYYTILAGEVKSLPEDLAQRFVEVYPFLEFAGDGARDIPEVKVQLKEEGEEVKEVEVKEVVKKTVKK